MRSNACTGTGTVYSVRVQLKKLLDRVKRLTTADFFNPTTAASPTLCKTIRAPLPDPPRHLLGFLASVACCYLRARHLTTHRHRAPHKNHDRPRHIYPPYRPKVHLSFLLGITTARAEVIYARWMQVNIGWSRVITVPVLLPVRDYYSTVLRYCTILLHSRIAFARRHG
jgi:hypothetical protein